MGINAKTGEILESSTECKVPRKAPSELLEVLVRTESRQIGAKILLRLCGCHR